MTARYTAAPTTMPTTAWLDTQWLVVKLDSFADMTDYVNVEVSMISSDVELVGATDSFELCPK